MEGDSGRLEGVRGGGEEPPAHTYDIPPSSTEENKKAPHPHSPREQNPPPQLDLDFSKKNKKALCQISEIEKTFVEWRKHFRSIKCSLCGEHGNHFHLHGNQSKSWNCFLPECQNV